MERQKSKRNICYAACLCAVFSLILLSVMAPQIFFFVQDNYRMKTTWKGEREGVDMLALNHVYGTLQQRLNSFAAGLAENRNYYVTETVYPVDQNTYGTVERLSVQEPLRLFNELLQEAGVTELWEPDVGYDIQTCKKYIIYDEGIRGGLSSVMFMGWYFELEFNREDRLCLLADATDDTLYYIQFVQGQVPDVKQNKDKVEMSVNSWKEADLHNLGEYLLNYYNSTGFLFEEEDASMNYSSDSGNFIYEYEIPYGENRLTFHYGGGLRKETGGQLYRFMGLEGLRNLISELNRIR